MTARSFRLRLALWSAALAGIALLSFALAVDWQVRRDKLDALDRELRLYTEREASHPRPPLDYWQQTEKNINRLIGHENKEAVVLWVQSPARDDYRSAHFPADVNVEDFDWSASLPPAMMPPPPPDENGFRPPPPPFGRHPPPIPNATISQIATPTAVWRFAFTHTPFVRLVIGVNTAVIERDMATMRSAFLVALPLALLLIGVGSALLSRRALAPVRHLTQTMQQVTAKGLHQRIAQGNEDIEFAELIGVFNAMLERLERGFLQASRFSADAAHELKTPLAILQGQIEQTMRQVDDGSPLQIRLSSILDEIQRLSTISRKLLLLSLADAGRLRLHKVRFNLSLALNELLDDAQMLAPQLRIQGDIAANLWLQADADLLWQVLHNLLSNAIKYNTETGYITISAKREAQQVRIEFTNSTPTDTKIDTARLFERFYRADTAHGRQIEGVGLGLSLAREIALAHGGELSLTKASKGKVTFLLVLA